MKSRVKLDDFAWRQMFLFLREQKDIRIGQPHHCRRFLNVILWINRTDAQWREIQTGFGKWNSIYKRYQRWRQQGIWQKLFEHFSNDPDLLPSHPMIE